MTLPSLSHKNNIFAEGMESNTFPSEAFYNRLAIVCLLLAFAYSCVRAYSLSITHDEAITYLNHATGSIFKIVTYRLPIRSNNHLLNTILIKIFTSLLGVSELVVRIPALIGLGLYLIGIYKIVSLFTTGYYLLLGVCLLTYHPFMLELFSCARGYSLGLGCSALALYYFLKGIKNPSSQDLKDNITASILLVFSALGHLSFFNMFVSVLGVLVIAEVIRLVGRRSPHAPIYKNHAYNTIFYSVVPSSLFLLMVYTYPVIKMMRAGNEFTYGGVNGFWKDTVDSLIRVTLFREGFLNSNLILLMKSSIIVLLLVSLAVLSYGRIVKREFTLMEKYLVSVLLVLLVCALSVIAQYHIFGIKYPFDRYALYFIPVFFLLVLLFWEIIKSAHSKWVRVPANWVLHLVAIVTLVHFISCANFTNFYQWKYDACTRSMMNSIMEMESGKNLGDNSIRLGIDWIFEPSVNFYIVKNRMRWMQKVDRDGPERQFDYYYITSNYEGLLDKYGLKVIRTYSLSGTYLAVASKGGR